MVPARADADHSMGMRLVLEVCYGFSVNGGMNGAPVEAQFHPVPPRCIHNNLTRGQLLLSLFVSGREQRPMPVRLHAQHISAGIAGLAVGEYIG